MKEHYNAKLDDQLMEQKKDVRIALSFQHWDVGHASWLVPSLKQNKHGDANISVRTRYEVQSIHLHYSQLFCC